jgi:hypothetical protein
MIGVHAGDAEDSVNPVANETLDNGLTGGNDLLHGWNPRLQQW